MIEGRALNLQVAGSRGQCDNGGYSWQSANGIVDDALKAAKIGTWQLDMLTGLGSCNSIACEVLGLDRAAVIEEKGAIPVHPDDQAAVVASLDRSFRTGATHDVECRILADDGQIRWVRAIAQPPGGASNAPSLIGIVTDVTARKVAEHRLVESRRQLATLIDNLPGVAYRCHAEAPRALTFISETVEKLTGYCAKDFLSGTLAWSDILHPADVDTWNEQIQEAIEQFRSFTGVYRIINRSGDIRWVQGSGEATYGEKGRPVSIEGFIQDVTTERAIRKELRWNASHDSLTGMPNRKCFHEKLDQTITQSEADYKAFALLILDIDDFKTVNDTLGHDAGDTLLCTFAERLKAAAGPDDVIARLGGDEFAVILKNADSEQSAHAAAGAIVASLRPTIVYNGSAIDCCPSVGISLYPFHGAKRVDLMKHADLALYAAKATGRAGIAVYQSSMRAAMQTRSSMLNVAQEALRQRRVFPFYQPKVDLVSGTILGFEALLRWYDPRGEIRPPGMISAAFDDIELATLISDQMIERALADAAEWRRIGLPFGHVAINAAAAEFRNGNFADSLIDRVERAGLLPEHIKIEVTESVFLGRGSECVAEALHSLRARGVKVALDDFGTGFASLSHLREIPVDELKIDRSFVSCVHRHRESGAIIRGLLAIGEGLNIDVVAEGIEAVEELAALQAWGCDAGQGYLFAKPMSADAIKLLLARGADWKSLTAACRQFIDPERGS